MYQARYIDAKDTKDGTVLTVLLPYESRVDEFLRLKATSPYLKGTVYFEDGRLISSNQQRAIFALIRDVAEHLGYDPEYLRRLFHLWFGLYYDVGGFSLSHHNPDCASVSLARGFITFLLEFCLEHEIPLRDSALSLTDDTDKYLYLCIKYRKCVICGKSGEVHHQDVIGMGYDRNRVDDSGHKKICLCREHHSEAHSLGVKEFNKKHHVYGIIYNGKEADDEQSNLDRAAD